ncbi:MAG: hypothetical protein JNK79_13585 [Chitinophagaceae bacterium]|nr:hypothetical protein [Chitinophagaceae bacterium]
MKKLLSLKAWQLFVICLLGYITLPYGIGEIIDAISGILFVVWMYAIGYYGEEKLRLMGLPAKNFELFRFNVYFIIILGVLMNILFFVWTPEEGMFDSFESWFIIPIMMILYFLYAMLHSLVFVSKTISELERKQPASFGDFVVNLVLLVIFVIGVWFLVPKVKKYLVGEYDEANLFESI